MEEASRLAGELSDAQETLDEITRELAAASKAPRPARTAPTMTRDAPAAAIHAHQPGKPRYGLVPDHWTVPTFALSRPPPPAAVFLVPAP
ncbi:hypothetical protein GCM10025331_73100 [Actinoplanes utahensis]|nr:hypothetical protein Aut01nite_67810 [Actinoplanes utahensis]